MEGKQVSDDSGQTTACDEEIRLRLTRSLTFGLSVRPSSSTLSSLPKGSRRGLNSKAVESKTDVKLSLDEEDFTIFLDLDNPISYDFPWTLQYPEALSHQLPVKNPLINRLKRQRIILML